MPAVMYGYFYLMAIKRVPKWFSPMWITGFQISQMFIGIFVAVKHVRPHRHSPCGSHALGCTDPA